LVEAKDFASATAFLEDLLPEAAAADKPKILDLLRQSYEALAEQAEASGRDRDARHYRDNLAIINRSRPAPAGAKSADDNPKKTSGRKPAARKTTGSDTKASRQPRAAVPHAPQNTPERDSTAVLPEPASLPEPATMPPAESLRKLAPLPDPVGAPSAAHAPLQSAPAPARNDQAGDRGDAFGASAQPAASPARPSRSPAGSDIGTTGASRTGRRTTGVTLEEADRLFSGKRYTEAGQCYATLARENRLPAARKNHWAYCRMVDVAIRMNARPRSSREWDRIEAEIESIQRLAPNQWCAEYLRNKLAEVRREQRRLQPPADNRIVRSGADDESDAPPSRPRPFGNSHAAAPNQPDATTPEEPTAAAPSGPQAAHEKASSRSTTANANSWQVTETPNFRILHRDVELAKRTGEVAESIRMVQARQWGSPALQRPWTPRCEIYLYPTGTAFARATNQPETAPGFSSMESHDGKITVRRTMLRADNPHLLTAVLPHEITHVVIADLFAREQIPFWADEGIAVLAEPDAEQNLRTADLRESLQSGKVVPMRELLTTDNPQTSNASAYYAQCVSLTRFLVEQGGRGKFLQFVQDSHSKGIDGALRDSYRIVGFDELQDRWMAYAREQLKTLQQAKRDPVAGPDASSVR
jgi:hypothetical protein